MAMLLPAFGLQGSRIAVGPKAPEAGSEFVPTVPASAVTRIEQHIAEAEYEASPVDGGWSAPNRAQDLRATYRPDGVEIVPRRGGASWCWRWQTTSWGREGRLENAGTVAPSSSGHRVSYERPNFVEWYENDPRGIEQGFTIAARPSGQGAIFIEARLETGLEAGASDDGALAFTHPGGAAALSYDDLVAFDAGGASLPARLAREGARVRIEVDDRGARYPITIDPLITVPAWSADGGVAGAQLGFSASTAGDVNGDGYSDLLAGAPGYDNGAGQSPGRVFFFSGTANGLAAGAAWSAKLDALGGLGQFGESVGPAGDVNGDGYDDILVGAPEYADDALAAEGHVFVWYGGPSGGGGGASGLGANGTAANADWEAESDEEQALLGRSVSTAGDVNGDGYDDVIVGAPGFDSDEGDAFLWLGSSTGLGTDGTPANADWRTDWTTATNAAGWCVATAGDVNADGYADVLVGVPLGTNGQAQEGGVFLWLGSASGLGANGTPFNADWRAEANQAFAELGRSLGPAGDVDGDGYGDIVVGAHKYDNGSADEGAAFVWLGSSTGLGTNGTPANADWRAEGNAANLFFGTSVATAGDTDGDGFAEIIVGCPEGDGGEGTASVYRGGASGPASAAIWVISSGQAGADLGNCVATAGDVNGDGFSDVLIAAWLFDNGQINEGITYVYNGSGNGPELSSGWSSAGNQANADFGVSVASAGDVNGDGFSDILVGAPDYDSGQADEGKVFLYPGQAIDPSFVPIWTAESNQAGAKLGGSVACAGDVNGDGYSDVLAGAESYDNGQTDEGRAFVWFGSPTMSGGGTPSNASWSAESDQANAFFGTCVASAGDVDGDGFTDLAIGAPFYDNVEVNEGRVYVYHGSPTGPSAVADWIEERNQAGEQFGASLASAGDVNGDGYSDLIVGAPNYDASQTNEGRAWVYHGSSGGLAAGAAWFADIDEAGAGLGSSVAGAGDVNGDGYSDVVVSAPSHSGGQTNEGEVRVYLGSAAGVVASYWSLEGNVALGLFGYAVASAGDVNGDGYSDVLVGSPGAASFAGKAFVYFGSTAGISSVGAWERTGASAGDQLGVSVACAGDVTGDGFADVIVGADGFTDGENDEGGAFVHYGNGINGLERVPRQMRASADAPIDLLGLSDSPSSFEIRLLGRTGAGRGRVRLEWEVEPVGTPFDGAGVQSGSLVDTGSPGTSGSVVLLAALASGLEANAPVHWRARSVSRSPYFPRSPWFSPAGNARTETDVRMGAEPVAVGDPATGTGAFDARALRAFPNPFASSSLIRYEVPERGHVELAIFDVQGRLVRTLVDAVQLEGPQAMAWDGRDDRGTTSSPGVYLLRLTIAGVERVEKLVRDR